MEAHICTLFLHTAKNGNRLRQCKYHKATYQYYDFSNHTKLLYIINCFILFSCPKTLSNNCHQAYAYTDCCNSVQIFQNVRHCLCCDRSSSQCGYSRLDCQFTKLEHTVFDTGRNSDSQNTSDHRPVRTDFEVVTHNNLLSVFSKLNQNHNCTEHT